MATRARPREGGRPPSELADDNLLTINLLKMLCVGSADVQQGAPRHEPPAVAPRQPARPPARGQLEVLDLRGAGQGAASEPWAPTTREKRCNQEF